ncbi:DsbA family protein [Alkalihalobacillus pseudalcaliphilus]|uniref:DsbA family protein n=1 Tax=Alkalihalobacillus pseudalcaliphilus TaxID=79884 RepID=UPI00064E00F9|nr:DsbA family protein [Alkalihalobacillus pseudalcaliphilus]KMK76270.1 dihydroneopterin aldolase [Alkalihalobacillus pseudalcaliphilus]
MTNKKNQFPKTMVVITLIIVGLVIATFYSLTRNDAVAPTNEFEEIPNIEGQPTLGNEGAPVTVIEFGDYKCPACKAWDESIFPLLKESYIDTGKVNYSYINTPFHGEESVLAALASESVWDQDPEGFWNFHKEVFQQQPDVQNHDDAWITPEKLIEIAEQVNVNVDLDQLMNDIVNQTYVDEVLNDQAQVEKFNVSLTPSIFINDTMVEDPFDYDTIVKLIEENLEENERE